MGKIEEKLLADFKKANKERKQKLAERFGFKTSDEYKKYLTTCIQRNIKCTPKSSKASTKAVVKAIIHNVTLLDATGSMQGDKYDNAVKGIKKELSEINSTEEVTIKHSLYEFIQASKPLTEHFIDLETSPKRINFTGAIGYDTPLWWSVVEVLNKFKSVSKKDKVLLKVYTDGENNSKGNYRPMCKELIRTLQKDNFTVTFVGTDKDLSGIVQSLSLDSSNCLAIENSGDGFEKAFKTSNTATLNYVTNVAKGKNVSSNFYKEIVNK